MMGSVRRIPAHGKAHIRLEANEEQCIKLDLKSARPLPPGFGGGFPEYHNTWAVTVQPGS
jgi:hypothetical protein